MYKDTWIYKYFNYEVKCENGIVYFWDPRKSIIVDSYKDPEYRRFRIYANIPKLTKPYFYPLSEWKIISPVYSNVSIETDLLSRVPHGFRTKSYPSSKSIYYTSPYFFICKTPLIVESNALLFNNFLKPNSEQSILAMTTYDEEANTLKSFFSPTVIIPFLNTFSLPKTLEFTLMDANKYKIDLDNSSQLYILLTLL